MKKMDRKKAQLTVARSERISRRRVVSLMSALVVLATAVALTMPAISMTRGELVCGIEEHQHDDACYEQVLVCGYDDATAAEQAGHTHSSGCYEARLTCQKPVHVHSIACYAEPEGASEGEYAQGTQSSQDDVESQGGIEELASPDAEGAADVSGEAEPQDDSVAETGDDSAETAAYVSENADDAAQNGEEIADGGEAAEGDTAEGEAAEDNAPEGAESAGEEAAGDQLEDAEATDSALLTEGEAADNAAESNTNMPAKSFSADVKAPDGSTISVSVEADEGAFPEDVTMKAELVTDGEVIDAAKAEASNELGGTDENTCALAVDITFFDAEGNPIEPAKDVRVSVKAKEIAEQEQLAVVHVDDEANATLVESSELDADEGAVSFDAGEFSVYALVYTVDFEYSVNGKMYQFSLPGGGFVSFTDLVEVLGIVGDSDSDNNGDENESVIAENADENSVNSNASTALMLGDVEVSEATREFVANVERVEFSAPSLVDVSKVDEDTTVGQIKENRGLECEYSAELTEEQITEINAQTVESGDWALISVHPFASQETLTVTMKNGDQFTVKVTDDQEIATFQKLKDNGTTTVVIWTYNSSTGKYYALKNDGTTQPLNTRGEIDTLPREFLWNYTYKWGNDFWVNSVADPSKFLFLCNENELIRGEACNIYTAETGNGGFYLNGYNNRYLWLDNSNNFHENLNNGSVIHLSEQKQLNAYAYTVKSENSSMGTVNVSSGTTDSSFKNAVVITATPNSTPVDNHGHTKYIFDYWDLNGTKRTDLPQSIAVGGVTFPWTNSTLTAHFKRNPDYEEQDDDQKHGREFTDEEKRELEGWLTELKQHAVPFNIASTNKTAELYDYENRIYQVDITAKSSLETFDGVIDLGFILDMSGSMQFPADLKEAAVVGSTDSTSGWYVRRNVRTSDNTDLRSYGWTENYWGGIEVSNGDGQVLIGRLNDDDTTKQILNRNKTYYYVADRAGTFTIFHMKYDWSEDNGRGAWVSSDASWNSYGRMGWNTYAKSNDPRGLYYTLYEASQNGSYTKNATTLDDKDRNRKWYLENSLNSTIGECNDILEKISIAKGDANNKNPDVEIAYNTFFWKVDQKSYNFVSTTGIIDNLSYDTDGGTGTDLALLSATGEKYSNEDFNGGSGDKTQYTQQSYTASGDNPAGFQWKTNDNRYVILITDGAPQANSKAIHSQYVMDAANKLKNEDNVTLITVGLSMKDVRRGSVLLYDIASRDETGEPMFFAAEGNDLKYVLYSIVRSIIQKAIVEGNVTDTVNEAFYPVDILSGSPLADGQVINLKGEKIADKVADLTNEQKAKGYGVVTEEGGDYSITWTSQEIGWEPWHGIFYQKAKEHFLGGNTVRTNDPENPAIIEATGYKFNPGDSTIAITQNPDILSETNYKRTFESPRVNVNELNFTMNDTEWTVYLEENVDPLDELKRLYSKIDVEMVVQKDKNDQVDGNKDNYSFELNYDTSDTRSPHGIRDTFPLHQVFPLDDADWNKLINGETITKTYDAYGQDCPSTYKVTLTKDHDPNSHSATVDETYKLEAVLCPLHDHLPAGLGGTDPYEYHTGGFKSHDPGLTAGDDDSVNNHLINVFVKGLQITKKGQDFANKLKGAEFKLYRTARNGETENLKEINGKQFFPITTLNMASDSVAIIDQVKALNEGEEYYLVETKAPDGYNLLTDPIPVNLEITNMYIPKPGNTATSTKPVSGPYSWTQSAKLTLGSSPWVRRTNNTGVEDLTGAALNANSQNETMYYDIANDAGVELPSTGGPGTRLFTILGSILIFGAGAVLWRKRRLA